MITPRPILVTDLDGTITTSPLHCGGNNAFGAAVWGGLKSLGIAKRMMRSAAPNPLAVSWLEAFQDSGWTIAIVTARESYFTELTHSWLEQHRVPHDLLALREPGRDIINHKAGWIADLTYCARYSEVDTLIIDGHVALYLDDQAEIIAGVADALGAKCPPAIQITDWRAAAPALRYFIRNISRNTS